ncbi:MAG: NADH-ubiquinone oxidoreductase-F iron-sulfur binding region domain-containing protein [Bacillota bacterium]|nr:NADH-ubiquinone oxidoreductase-F iron-sulfur binding region domain-containing protein [Bacillota bacterium]
MALEQVKLEPGLRLRPRILIGLGSCGLAAGGEEVRSAFLAALRRLGLEAEVRPTGCLGLCHQEVLVEVRLPGLPPAFYARVTPEKAERIAEEHLGRGRVVEEWLLPGGEAGGEFLQGQTRICLRNCGRIDPEDLDEALGAGCYLALGKALREMKPEEVVAEVRRSGLRGRGGAGFPTWRKWEEVRRAPGPEKYVICNGDEGDPGVFINRTLLEGDPHSVLEGMAIAAYAVGAATGYLYVRTEYPLAIRRLRRAIEQAEARGLLGRDILGSGFHFSVQVVEGNGAFVCGEETALIASLQGERGVPRPRPPYPSTAGLWGKPTVVNNVETLAAVAPIIQRGGSWYAGFGQGESRGTKVFALSGEVERPGLVEVPLGLPLRRLIYELGGGIREGRSLKAVLIGGPSGGCLPPGLLDTSMDYEALERVGAMIGSGDVVALDERHCLPDLARFIAEFAAAESCGNCLPCREGLHQLLALLDRIVRGEAEEGALEELQALAELVRDTSLCGLGRTAPNVVLSTLRYFRAEYEAHVLEKRCPANACPHLRSFYIVPERCRGCARCVGACPRGCISGQPGQPYRIDSGRCIRCGECQRACVFGAVAS